MRAVVQRVSEAQVRVDREVVGKIERGLCVFVCVMNGDTSDDALWLAKKIVTLRIFSDTDDRMNLSVKDINGSVLAVSQFTLSGDVRKGNRPSFTEAMAPSQAQELFCVFCEQVRASKTTCETGRFRTHMEVLLKNDGPVTILLDSHRKF